MIHVILAIESSCDDTAMAVISLEGKVLYDVVADQNAIHAQFGGVVPEVASRNHLLNIQYIFQNNIKPMLGIEWDVVAIVATSGPGLMGSLSVGVMFAKGLSQAMDVPFIPINHLEGHLLSPKIHEKELQFPFLGLLISGGHCQIVIAKALGSYEIIGHTLDDSVGEVFDKVGRVLGLSYPAGKIIDNLAQTGKPRFHMPTPMLKKAGLQMSFSGLKTFASVLIKRLRDENGLTERESLNDEDLADICYALQETITLSLKGKMRSAMEQYIEIFPDLSDRRCVISGGVSANSSIRAMMDNLANTYAFQMYKPLQKYCTDNAAMIAVAGLEYFNKHLSTPSSLLSDIKSSNVQQEQIELNNFHKTKNGEMNNAKNTINSDMNYLHFTPRSVWRLDDMTT